MDNAFGYKSKQLGNYSDFLAQFDSADLILTPTRRLAKRLNLDYVQTHVSPTQLPIVSLAGWLDSLWQAYEDDLDNPPLRLLNPWQNALIWQSIIDETNLTPLLRKEQTARLAEKAWSLLKSWGISTQRVFNEALTADIRAFLTWCDSYEARARIEKWCDHASRLDYLLLAKQQVKLKIHLVGFTDISPKVRQLLLHVAGNADAITVLSYRTPDAKVVYAAQPDFKTELTAAAIWAKQWLKEPRVHPIGIIVPDLATRFNAVDEIFATVLMPESLIAHHYQQARPYNISAGKKLADYPVIVLAFELLRLTHTQWPLERLSRVLLTPFILASEQECFARAYLDATLRHMGLTKVTLEKVQAASGNTCIALMQALVQQPAAPKQSLTPSAWVHYIKQKLTHWGWPGERVLNSLEYQVVKRFYELLTEFSQLDGIVAPLNFSAACQLLGQQAKSILFQGESEDKPIQILGHLEAVGLHFHALWVNGLHNENWPMPCAPHPFLPARLQRINDMPHATPEREYAFAENLTQRFTEQAQHIVLSFPLQEEDKKLSPSALILPYAAHNSLLQEDVSLLPEKRAAFEEWHEQAVPYRSKDAVVRGGTSVLQAQANCPFQAFARYRLFAEDFTVPQSGFTALHRGQVLHAALDYFWQVIQTKEKLIRLSEAAYAQHVDAAITKALTVIEDAQFTRMQLTLEKQRVTALVDEYLRHERMRPDFTVIAREQAIKIELASLKLNARIDRIDQLATGEIILIDYKTGRIDEPDWLEPRLRAVQLPLYALSMPEVQGIVFAQVKVEAIKWIGISAQAGHLPNVKSVNDLEIDIKWPELLAHWRKGLTVLADEFYQGQAQVHPLEGEKTCRYCDLALLCRIRRAS